VNLHGLLTSPARLIAGRASPITVELALFKVSPAQGPPIATQPNHLLLRQDFHPLACQRSKAAQSDRDGRAGLCRQHFLSPPSCLRGAPKRRFGATAAGALTFFHRDPRLKPWAIFAHP